MARFSKLDFKTAIKTAMIQLRQARQREQNNSCIQKASVVEALKADRLDKAKVRVEAVIRTDITLEIYDYLENYLEILSTRDHLIEREKDCPLTLVEAVHSIIFASSNVEFTAIHTLYSIFEAKYGRGIIKAALDVDGEPAKGRAPSSKANAMLVSKIRSTVPSPLVVSKCLEDIAAQEGIVLGNQTIQPVLINTPIVEPPFVQPIDVKSNNNMSMTVPPPIISDMTAPMPPAPQCCQPPCNNNNGNNDNQQQPPAAPTGFGNINDELASLSSRIGGL